MRQLFVSYARENKPDVEALVRDLDALGYQTWDKADTALRPGCRRGTRSGSARV
jgi:hypothetical protein